MSRMEKSAWIALGWLALLAFVYFAVGGVAAWFLVSLSLAVLVYLARREERLKTLPAGAAFRHSDKLPGARGRSTEMAR